MRPPVNRAFSRSMFLPFFLRLKQEKVPVTLREYLALLEGLEAGKGRFECLIHLGKRRAMAGNHHPHRQGGDQVRVQELAVRDGDDHIRPAGVKSQKHTAFCLACRQGGTAARLGGRCQGGPEAGLQPLPGQGAVHDAFFPSLHESIGRVLHQATAAGSGVRAGRFLAVG